MPNLNVLPHAAWGSVRRSLDSNIQEHDLNDLEFIPADIALNLAERSHGDEYPDFAFHVSTQDCIYNILDPERTQRFASLSIYRHFSSKFVEWSDRQSYALRNRFATGTQKCALADREALIHESGLAMGDLRSVQDVWHEILDQNRLINNSDNRYSELSLSDLGSRLTSVVGNWMNAGDSQNLPWNSARYLYGWGDAEIRETLARNSSVPLDILMNLVNDEDTNVARACVDNTNCTGDLADFLESRFPDLADTLDTHRGADIVRQYRLPLRRLSGEGEEWFLHSVRATSIEADAFDSAVIDAKRNEANQTVKETWHSIAWQ